MMRYIGSIVGAGVLGAVLSEGSGPPDVDLFRLMYVVLVAMAALAMVSTLFIHRFTPGRQRGRGPERRWRGRLPPQRRHR